MSVTIYNLPSLLAPVSLVYFIYFLLLLLLLSSPLSLPSPDLHFQEQPISEYKGTWKKGFTLLLHGRHTSLLLLIQGCILAHSPGEKTVFSAPFLITAWFFLPHPIYLLIFSIRFVLFI